MDTRLGNTTIRNTQDYHIAGSKTPLMFCEYFKKNILEEIGIADVIREQIDVLAANGANNVKNKFRELLNEYTDNELITVRCHCHRVEIVATRAYKKFYCWDILEPIIIEPMIYFYKLIRMGADLTSEGFLRTSLETFEQDKDTHGIDSFQQTAGVLIGRERDRSSMISAIQELKTNDGAIMIEYNLTQSKGSILESTSLKKMCNFLLNGHAWRARCRKLSQMSMFAAKLAPLYTAKTFAGTYAAEKRPADQHQKESEYSANIQAQGDAEREESGQEQVEQSILEAESVEENVFHTADEEEFDQVFLGETNIF
ncbi:unnamed protein product [Allacma fusca]|uniref:Uncharacterized protein n=1 Tax=Allacma fusca TaxID=39272 RepID=A0A8J2P7I4_9HEXA|nr:unnamed protein product [Allacma fusca]